MMIVRNSAAKVTQRSAEIRTVVDSYSGADLRCIVEKISVSRHFRQQRTQNRAVAEWLAAELASAGFVVTMQGTYGNVVASISGTPFRSSHLLGAHFDSVPNTPGADDNASGVAGVLSLAKHLAKLGCADGITFVLFNAEEDGLLGSSEFAEDIPRDHLLREVHILEMIGYTAIGPGSQQLPKGLPIRLRDEGDFIALIANSQSNPIADQIIRNSEWYVRDLKVLALKTYFGMEKRCTHLGRSDHSPFWSAGIPALMWTDTSEFRNPHYHRPSDTPDTLDYRFLKNVTALAMAQILGGRQSVDRAGAPRVVSDPAEE